jgi:hypothetical protein
MENPFIISSEKGQKLFPEIIAKNVGGLEGRGDEEESF